MLGKIGFIGSGNISEALIRGFIPSIGPENIVVADALPGKAEAFAKKHGTGFAKSNEELIAGVSTVFLAVKPQHFSALLTELGQRASPKTLFVSIVTGFSIQSILSKLAPGTRLVRIMPNTPVGVGRGMTAVAPGPGVDEADIKELVALLSGSGLADVVDEKHFNAITGLSGSGPAYAFLFIEALADGAVLEGLPRDKAYRYAAQTLLGAATMVLEGGQPGALKDAVSSPGGTTIEGIRALEAHGFRSACIEAVSAAARKAASLAG